MSNNVAGYNYSDFFEATAVAGDDRSPEEWARAVFEDAPWLVRWFLLAGWGLVLGLRLGPRPSPGHVLGWEIVQTEPNSVMLELQSWVLTARLVFRAEQANVMQATFVRYEQGIARIIWPPVSIVHRQVVPRLLQRAVADAVTPNDQPGK
jgi:hypothetical protein